jgi:hypothetical protein
LIGFAVGLILLEIGLFVFPKLLPRHFEAPGGIATWILYMAVIYLVIPISFLVALAGIFILSDTTNVRR